MEKKRIGVLTGGGDAQGLNAAIRAVAKKAIQLGCEVIGIKNGFQGLLEDPPQTIKLTRRKASGIIDRGGTILGGDAMRANPLKVENGVELVFRNFRKLRLEALVIIGGEGTLGMAHKLSEMGLPIVGIPKTIDNDVKGTDYTIGFQTAVQIATEIADRLRTTAESHHQVMVLELMGRNAGWIATYAGMASGADEIIIPEVKPDINALCEMVKKRKAQGNNFTVIVVSEGAQLGNIDDTIKDKYDHVELREREVGHYLADLITKKTGIEARASVPGRELRGGSPCAYDRNLATIFGVRAVELVRDGKFGMMVGIKGDKLISVPLALVDSGIKTVNMNTYHMAEVFFG